MNRFTFLEQNKISLTRKPAGAKCHENSDPHLSSPSSVILAGCMQAGEVFCNICASVAAFNNRPFYSGVLS